MSVRKLFILLYRDKEKRSIMCLHFESYYDMLREAVKILSLSYVISVTIQEWDQKGNITKQKTIRKTLYKVYPAGRPNGIKYETYNKEKAEFIAKEIGGGIEIIEDPYYKMLMCKRQEEDPA